MMKNYFYKILLAAFITCTTSISAQTYTIDFETPGDGYTALTTEGSTFIDVFNRIPSTVGSNTSFIWAVEDTNVADVDKVINLTQINVPSATGFTFSLDMIAHHYNDWDNTDELLITYSTDGGSTYQNLMWVQSISDAGNDFNEPAAIDTDFNGIGECAGVLPAITTGTGATGCTVTASDFQNFTTAMISLSGVATLDIRFQFNGFTATDEGLYIDNIVVNVETPVASTDSFNTIQASVYPNPVKDGKIFIKSSSSEVKEVKVYNILGRKVIDTKVSSDEEINVNSLSSGMYMVTITENNKTLTKKIVIQ